MRDRVVVMNKVGVIWKRTGSSQFLLRLLRTVALIQIHFVLKPVATLLETHLVPRLTGDLIGNSCLTGVSNRVAMTVIIMT